MAEEKTLEDLEKHMVRLGSGELLKSFKKAMGVVALKSERYAKQYATREPRVRSGRLRSSIAAEVLVSASDIEIKVGAGGSSRQKHFGTSEYHSEPTGHADVPYAMIHEFGGTIQSRTGSRTRAGVFREPRSSSPGKPIRITAKRYLSKGVERAMKEAPTAISEMITPTILGKKI